MGWQSERGWYDDACPATVPTLPTDGLSAGCARSAERHPPFNRRQAVVGFRAVTCEHLHVNPTAKLALAVSAVAVALSLAGCAVPTDRASAPESSTEPTSTGSTSSPTATRESRPPTATPTHTQPVDPRDDAYDAEVAAWADEIPAGYAWPSSISGLPAGRWTGKGEPPTSAEFRGFLHPFVAGD